MAKRVIDDGTLTSIADKIRESAPSLEGTTFTPTKMPEKIDAVYNSGRAEAEQIATEEKAALSLSLSEALTSGASNTESLETNVEQAKADLVNIKKFITHTLSTDVPEGTLSSEYNNFLFSGVMNAMNESWDDGAEQCRINIYKNTINPAKDKLSQRIRGEVGTESTLDDYVETTISDLDSIEAAIEAQGVDVPDNDTSTMAELIGTLCEEKYTSGKTEGIAEGYNTGYTEGESTGIEQGKQSAYDGFWDIYQNKGLVYSCQYMFAYARWNDATFKPKYSLLYITNASNMFNTCGITDLQAALDAQGVTFNFENSTLFNYTFAYSNLSRIGVINTLKSNSLSSTCAYAERLTTIEKLILNSNGTQTFSGTFTACSSLANITIEGVIGNSISFSSSPLTKESITSVVNALSSTATGKTLTLKMSAVEAAFSDDEWAALVAQKSNWTISLA